MVSANSAGGTDATGSWSTPPRASRWAYDARGTETTQHRGVGQRCEGAQRAEPEPSEEVDELLAASVPRVNRRAQHRDGPGREERGRRVPGHDVHRRPGFGGARGELGCERAVGDPYPHVGALRRRAQRDDPRRQGVVATEVARTDHASANDNVPGSSSTRRGTSCSTARTTISNARASASSSASSTVRPAQRASASRRRNPTVTPSSRASADAAATTRPRAAAVDHHHRSTRQLRIPTASRHDRPVRTPAGSTSALRARLCFVS